MLLFFPFSCFCFFSHPPARPPAQAVTQKQAAPTRHGVINTRTRGPSIAAAAKRAKSSTDSLSAWFPRAERPSPAHQKQYIVSQVSALRAQIIPEITSLGFWGATSPPSSSGASPRTSPSAVPDGAFRPLVDFLPSQVQLQETSPELQRSLPARARIQITRDGGRGEGQARAECGEIDELM